MSRLEAYETAPTTDGDLRRALQLQQLLAEPGQHRALSLVDALVAAVAETRKLTVLHYDRDFELVADITGQPHRWIVGRGTAN
jgi:predicted nucleic acid-binding protein